MNDSQEYNYMVGKHLFLLSTVNCRLSTVDCQLKDFTMFGLELPANARDIFFPTVWKIVRLIPPGKVSTYGQIAGYIPALEGVLPDDFLANRARWVGHAMAASP